MGNELITVSMKNYLSSPAISKYVEDMLGTRKGTFIATITSLVNTNSKLQACDKSTILMAALKATGLNLPIEPSLGFAYVIPYGTEAQFQISYKGLIQLALRSGSYAGINSMEVREGEFHGRDELGDPIINWLDESERLRKPVIGYLAAFKTIRGFTKKVYWKIEQVEKHAERFSQGYRSYKAKGKSQSTARIGNLTNPWESDFDSMACKTVLKSALSKYGELSVEMKDAIAADQAIIRLDNGQEVIEYIDNPKDITEVSTTLTKEQQELIFKSYDTNIISEALHNLNVQDITSIEQTSFDDFVKECVVIKAENDKLSK